MKTFLTKYRTDINVFAFFLYVFFLLFAYDSFCFDTVTTETPLLKIGDFPLLRTEFTAFLFSLTSVVGAAAGIVLRIKEKNILHYLSQFRDLYCFSLHFSTSTLCRYSALRCV